VCLRFNYSSTLPEHGDGIRLTWNLLRVQRVGTIGVLCRDGPPKRSAEEETSPKIRFRTLKLLSFPIELADGGAYVEGL